MYFRSRIFTKMVIEIKILALDQSTKITGYSLWNNNLLIDYGVVTVDSKLDVISRMKKMSNMIGGLFLEHSPDCVVMEDIQLQYGNVRGFKALAHLQGVLMQKIFDANIVFFIVEPSAWKSYCGINKGIKMMAGEKRRDAEKRITLEFVNANYKHTSSEDIADSIGIGHWAINTIRGG